MRHKLVHMDLKSFYEVSSKELDAGDTAPASPPSHGYDVAKKKADPMQRVILLGQEKSRLQENTERLIKLMNEAKEGVPDALDMLVDTFRKTAKIVKVKLLEPLLDGDGHELKQFGMKELSPDEAKAEKQRQRLKTDLELVRQYYQNIELREIITADNKRVVVVIGVAAEEFNAVVLAEKTRRILERKVDEIDREMDKAHREVKESRQARNADDMEAETPFMIH